MEDARHAPLKDADRPVDQRLPLNESLEARLAERTRELADARVQIEALNDQRAQGGVIDTSEQFRLLVQGVVDYAIYMLDPNGQVITWNAGAERSKGYSDKEILGQHFSVFYTPEARVAGEPQRALQQARDTGRIEMEGWRLRKDGSRFWANVIIDAVYDDHGGIAGFAKVTRDITDRRRAAQELEQAREALVQSQKMEAVGQLTGGIAHDFNNMLAGIIGAMHLLERRLAAKRYDEASKYVVAALESANRAAALTSRLLAFGRRQSLDLKAVDVTAAIQSIEGLLQRSIGENVTIETKLAPDLPRALSDTHQLESAILNLTINARDAMPNGGRIVVSTEPVAIRGTAATRDLPVGDYVLVAVTDQGVGMSPDVIARAFEPFFTTKPSGAGTGLGLSMVYGFVKQSGGHVIIESAPNAGATVKLFLPVAPSQTASEAAGPAVDAKELTGRGEVVLVVEDDTLVRTLVLDVLQDLGYQAKEAVDAKEALPIIQSSQRIDLLISDVGLPGINGRQLAELARQHRPNLKVLFLTGYAEHAAVRSNFLGEGMDLMTKPFAVEGLAAKIQEILNAS
ncbi:MAG: ATP-binding protein [Terricaulis sp.]